MKFLATLILFLSVCTVQPTIGLTVFIHGTTGSLISLLGHYKIAPRALVAQKKFREHPILWQDQPMLQQGFIEITPEKLTDSKMGRLSPHEAQCACYHIMSTYDAVAGHVGLSEDINQYALFGWSGLLSHEKRQEAAHDLYDALCNYREKIEKQYGITPVIRIVSHSHGGTVALGLGDAEKIKKRDLQVELLAMLGTPISVEMKDCITSLVFKKIISGHSDGDKVQNKDRFSIKSGKSYRKMKDVVDLNSFMRRYPGYERCDLHLKVNQDTHIIDHCNMWHLGRSKKISDVLGPLPFVVLLPAILKHTHPHYSASTVKVVHNGLNLSVSVNTCIHGKNVFVGNSINLHTIIHNCCNQVIASWHPLDTSRNVLFNTKNKIALRYVFNRDK